MSVLQDPLWGALRKPGPPEEPVQPGVLSDPGWEEAKLPTGLAQPKKKKDRDEEVALPGGITSDPAWQASKPARRPVETGWLTREFADSFKKRFRVDANDPDSVARDAIRRNPQLGGLQTGYDTFRAIWDVEDPLWEKTKGIAESALRAAQVGNFAAAEGALTFVKAVKSGDPMQVVKSLAGPAVINNWMKAGKAALGKGPGVTFSDVLDEIGLDQLPGGKFASAIGGLALDIGLDPTTYLSPGGMTKLGRLSEIYSAAKFAERTGEAAVDWAKLAETAPKGSDAIEIASILAREGEDPLLIGRTFAEKIGKKQQALFGVSVPVGMKTWTTQLANQPVHTAESTALIKGAQIGDKISPADFERLRLAAPEVLQAAIEDVAPRAVGGRTVKIPVPRFETFGPTIPGLEQRLAQAGGKTSAFLRADVEAQGKLAQGVQKATSATIHAFGETFVPHWRERGMDKWYHKLNTERERTLRAAMYYRRSVFHEQAKKVGEGLSEQEFKDLTAFREEPLMAPIGNQRISDAELTRYFGTADEKTLADIRRSIQNLPGVQGELDAANKARRDLPRAGKMRDRMRTVADELEAREQALRDAIDSRADRPTLAKLKRAVLEARSAKKGLPKVEAKIADMQALAERQPYLHETVRTAKQNGKYYDKLVKDYERSIEHHTRALEQGPEYIVQRSGGSWTAEKTEESLAEKIEGYRKLTGRYPRQPTRVPAVGEPPLLEGPKLPPPEGPGPGLAGPETYPRLPGGGGTPARGITAPMVGEPGPADELAALQQKYDNLALQIDQGQAEAQAILQAGGEAAKNDPAALKMLVDDLNERQARIKDLQDERAATEIRLGEVQRKVAASEEMDRILSETEKILKKQQEDRLADVSRETTGEMADLLPEHRDELAALEKALKQAEISGRMDRAQVIQAELRKLRGETVPERAKRMAGGDIEEEIRLGGEYRETVRKERLRKAGEQKRYQRSITRPALYEAGQGKLDRLDFEGEYGTAVIERSRKTAMPGSKSQWRVTYLDKEGNTKATAFGQLEDLRDDVVDKGYKWVRPKPTKVKPAGKTPLEEAPHATSRVAKGKKQKAKKEEPVSILPEEPAAPPGGEPGAAPTPRPSQGTPGAGAPDRETMLAQEREYRAAVRAELDRAKAEVAGGGAATSRPIHPPAYLTDLPEVPEGHVRLFRAEGAGAEGMVPEWVKRSPKFAKTREATGRWFTHDWEALKWYRGEAGAAAKISYVDVPIEEARRYHLANAQGEFAGMEPGKFSKSPADEYFLPAELAAQKKPVTFQPGAEEIHGLKDLSAEAPAPAAAPPTPPAGLPGEAGQATKAYHLENPNVTFDLHYRGLNPEDITVSHTTGGAVNPDYPQQYQPRAREENVISAIQIRSNAGAFNLPSVIEDKGITSIGPPIVVSVQVEGKPKLIALTSNGRLLSLEIIRNEQPEVWKEFLRLSQEQAKRLGMDLKPGQILVRHLDTPMTPEQLVEFARRAQAGGAKMTEAERAAAIARLINPETIARLRIGEDQSIEDALEAAGNAEFIRGILAKMDPTERGIYATPKGTLSAEGLREIRNAIFSVTYRSEDGQRMLRSLVQSVDSDVRNIENSVMGNLALMAQLEGKVQAGLIGKEFSLADDLSQAVNVMARLKKSGMPVKEYFDQFVMGGEPPLEGFPAKILMFLEENVRGRGLRKALDNYAAGVLEQHKPAGLFGEVQIRNREELWDAATVTVRREQDAARAARRAKKEGAAEGDLFDAGGTVQDDLARNANDANGVQPPGESTASNTPRAEDVQGKPDEHGQPSSRPLVPVDKDGNPITTGQVIKAAQQEIDYRKAVEAARKAGQPIESVPLPPYRAQGGPEVLGTFRKFTNDQVVDILEQAQNNKESLWETILRLVQNQKGEYEPQVFRPWEWKKGPQTDRVRAAMAHEIVDDLIFIRPELNDKRRMLQELFDQMWTTEDSRGAVTAFLKNYMPHVPIDETSARVFFASPRARGLGFESFEKHRDLDWSIKRMNDIYAEWKGDPKARLFEDDALYLLGIRGGKSIRFQETFKSLHHTLDTIGVPTDKILDQLAADGYKLEDARRFASGAYRSSFIMGMTGADAATIREARGIETVFNRLGLGFKKGMIEAVDYLREIRMSSGKIRPDMPYAIKEFLVQHAGLKGSISPLDPDEVQKIFSSLSPDQLKKAAVDAQAELVRMRGRYEAIAPKTGLFLTRGEFEKIQKEFEAHAAGKTPYVDAEDVLNLLHEINLGPDDYLVGIDWDKATSLFRLVQAKRIRAWVIPHDIAVSMNKSYAFIGKGGQELTNFLGMAHRLTNIYKGWTLAGFPEYHFRNVFTNAWIMHAYAGMDDWGMWARSWDMLQGKGGNVFLDSLGREIPVEKLMKQAEELGILGHGFFGADIERFIREATREPRWWEAGPKMLPHVTKEGVKLERPIEVGLAAGRFLENNARLALYLDYLKKGYRPYDAAALVKKYLFDYTELTDREKTAFRLVFPFYSWLRKNLPLQIEMLIRRPWAQTLPAKMQESIQGATGQELSRAEMELLYPGLQKELPVRLGEVSGDKTAYLALARWLPTQDLIHTFDMPAETLLGQLSPLLSEPTSQALNYDLYLSRPIHTYGESFFDPTSWFSGGPYETRPYIGGPRLPVDLIHAFNRIRLLGMADRIMTIKDPEEKRTFLEYVSKALTDVVGYRPTRLDLQRRGRDIEKQYLDEIYRLNRGIEKEQEEGRPTEKLERKLERLQEQLDAILEAVP